MNRATAIAEWRRGLTSLESAEVLARAGQHEDAIVTSYYAIFHTAKAALAVHDIETSTHAGLRSMLPPMNVFASQAGLDQLPRLSRALAIYNRAFRDHLSTVLRKKLGPDWWQQGIVRRISTIQEDIENRGLEIETDIDALSVMEPKHCSTAGWVERMDYLAPAKTINGRRIEAQDTPLMESVCASEEGAFEWLREREESGQIRREALRAIRLFEREEREDEPAFESDALDDDIPF